MYSHPLGNIRGVFFEFQFFGVRYDKLHCFLTAQRTGYLIFLSELYRTRIHTANYGKHIFAACTLQRTISVFIYKRTISVVFFIYECISLVCGIIGDIKCAVRFAPKLFFQIHAEYAAIFGVT